MEGGKRLLRSGVTETSLEKVTEEDLAIIIGSITPNPFATVTLEEG